MNPTNELFDNRIADWLEADPDRAPAQVLDTIVAALPSIPQRRAAGPLGIAVRWLGLRFAPAGVAVAIVALVLVALAAGLIGRPPTPSPTPEATPGLVSFESPLYGYSIGHPDGWRVTPATERIKGINPPWVDTGVVDQFNGPPGSANANAVVVAAMSEVTEGTTLDNWTGQTARAVCGTPTTPPERIEVAGQPATVSTFARCNSYFHIWVTFVRGSQAFHVVWLNFTGTEAADRQLLDQILASFVLPEAAPEPTGTIAMSRDGTGSAPTAPPAPEP